MTDGTESMPRAVAEALERYRKYSAQASSIVRSLALAGIAVVWVFRIETDDTVRIDRWLIVPVGLMVLGLACDLIQYALATVVYEHIHRKLELRADLDPMEPLKVSVRTKSWIASFFWAKTGAVLVGYLWLIIYLGRALLLG